MPRGPHFKPGVYAKLCAHAYDPKSSPPDEWEVLYTSKIRVFDETRNASVFNYVTHDVVPYGDNYHGKYRAGYHGVLYRHKETGRPVLVNVGTDFDNTNGDRIQNLCSDVALAFRNMPEAYKYAQEFFSEINSKFPELMELLEISGHSWGGWVGEKQGIEHPNIPVQTFEAPGIREMLPREIQAQPFHNITNYVMEKNPINNTNTRAGRNFQLTPHPEDAREIARLTATINDTNTSVGDDFSHAIAKDTTRVKAYFERLFKIHSSDTCARAFDETGDFLSPPIEVKLDIKKVTPNHLYDGFISHPISNGIPPDQLEPAERDWLARGHYEFTYVPLTLPPKKEHPVQAQKSIDELLGTMSPSERQQWIDNNQDNLSYVEWVSNLVNVARQKQIAEWKHLSPYELSMKLNAEAAGLPKDYNWNGNSYLEKTLLARLPKQSQNSLPISDPQGNSEALLTPSQMAGSSPGLSTPISHPNVGDDSANPSIRETQGKDNLLSPGPSNGLFNLAPHLTANSVIPIFIPAAAASQDSPSEATSRVSLSYDSRRGVRGNLVTGNPVVAGVMIAGAAAIYLYQWLTTPEDQQAMKTLKSDIKEYISISKNEFSLKFWRDSAEDKMADIINEDLPNVLSHCGNDAAKKTFVAAIRYACKTKRSDLLEQMVNDRCDGIIKNYQDGANQLIQTFDLAERDGNVAEMIRTVRQMRDSYREQNFTYIKSALLAVKNNHFDSAKLNLKQAREYYSTHQNVFEVDACLKSIAETQKYVDQLEFKYEFAKVQSPSSGENTQAQQKLAEMVDKNLSEYPNEEFWLRANRNCAIQRNDKPALLKGLQAICKNSWCQIEDLEGLASEYENSGLQKESIETQIQISQRKPNHKSSAIKIASYYIETQELAKADKHLESYCKSAPKDYAMKLWRASLLAVDKNNEKARSVYQEVANNFAKENQLKPEDKDLYIQSLYGLIDTADDKNKAANKVHIDRILALDEEQSRAWQLNRDCAIGRNDKKTLLKSLQALCKNPSCSIDDLESLATEYENNGFKKESIETQIKIHGRHPNHKNAVIKIVNYYIEQKELTEADKHLEPYCQSVPQDVAMKNWRASLLAAAKNPEKARSIYQEIADDFAKAAELKPEDKKQYIQALYGLIDTANSKSNPENSTLIDQILDLDEGQARAWQLKGDASLQLNEPAQAIGYYNRALKYDERSPATHLGLAYAHVRKYNFETSKQHLRNILNNKNLSENEQIFKTQAQMMSQDLQEFQTLRGKQFCFDMVDRLAVIFLRYISSIPDKENGIPIDRERWIQKHPLRYLFNRGVSIGLNVHYLGGKDYIFGRMVHQSEQALRRLLGSAELPYRPSPLLTKMFVAQAFLAFTSFLNEWYADHEDFRKWVKETSYQWTGMSVEWDPAAGNILTNGLGLFCYGGYSVAQMKQVHRLSATILGVDANFIAGGCAIASVIHSTLKLREAYYKSYNQPVPRYRILYPIEDITSVIGHPALVFGTSVYAFFPDVFNHVGSEVGRYLLENAPLVLEHLQDIITAVPGGAALIAKSSAAIKAGSATAVKCGTATAVKAKAAWIAIGTGGQYALIATGAAGAVVIIFVGGYKIKRHYDHKHVETLIKDAKDEIESKDKTLPKTVHLDAAITILKEALSFEPENSQGQYRLIQASALKLMEENKSPDAIDLVSKALTGHPEQEKLLLLRAEIHCKNGNLDLADADLKSSKEIGSVSLREIHYKLGVVAHSQHNLVRAKSYFKEVQNELEQLTKVPCISSSQLSVINESINAIKSDIAIIDLDMERNFNAENKRVESVISQVTKNSTHLVKIVRLKRLASHLQALNTKEETSPEEVPVEPVVPVGDTTVEPELDTDNKKEEDKPTKLDQMLSQLGDANYQGFIKEKFKHDKAVAESQLSGILAENYNNLYACNRDEMLQTLNKTISCEVKKVNDYFVRLKIDIAKTISELNSILGINKTENSLHEIISKHKKEHSDILQEKETKISPEKYKILDDALTKGLDTLELNSKNELLAELEKLEAMQKDLTQLELEALDEVKILDKEMVIKLDEICEANDNKAWEQARMMVSAKVLGSAAAFFYDECKAQRQAAFIDKHKPLPEWVGPLEKRLRPKNNPQTSQTRQPPKEYCNINHIKQLEKRYVPS